MSRQTNIRRSSVLVVGAGIGGLAAAAMLSARGFDVQVLERASFSGGKLRTHLVGGLEVDAGPTVFTWRRVFDDLFEQAGARLDDFLTLTPLRTLARHAWTRGGDVSWFDLPADLEEAVDAIGRFAGAADARGYRAFCDRAGAIHAALDRTFMRAGRTGVAGLVRRGGFRGLPSMMRLAPFTTLWSALGNHFADPRLRQLFGRYATYCGSSPWLAPATLMLVAHVERSGVWSVGGGMRRVSDALSALAVKSGARLRHGAHVEEILEQGGRASGVRLAGGEILRADAVVFNGDVNALATGLLGHAATRGLGAAARRWRAPRGRSLSAITWSIAAATDADRAGHPAASLAHHNVLFSSDYQAEFDALGRGRLPADPTVYVCAANAGDGHGGDAPRGLLCLVNAPAHADARHLTDQEIDECESQAFRRMALCGIPVTPSTPMRRTTPADFATMFPATGGALYGPPSHGWRASFQRPGARHALPGLYLAGGSTHPGPGLPMAALSGQQAARAICEDLASTSRSCRTDTPGGMWMR